MSWIPAALGEPPAPFTCALVAGVVRMLRGVCNPAAGPAEVDPDPRDVKVLRRLARGHLHPAHWVDRDAGLAFDLRTGRGIDGVRQQRGSKAVGMLRRFAGGLMVRVAVGPTFAVRVRLPAQ